MGGRASRARAQTGTVVEGALEFVLPTGARAMGMGQAVAASATGVDALWWNPALIARGPREVGGHFAQQSADKGGSDLSAAFIYPIPRLGAFAISYRYLNNGEEDATSDQTGQIGTFFTKSTVLGFTFAPILTSRFVAGLTYKLLRISFDCTGDCNLPGGVPTTFALDLGGAFRVTSDSLVVVGLALRNLGVPLQVNDSPQSDQLPSRADVGVAVSPTIPRWPEGHVRLSADVVTRVAGGGGPGFRVGAELSLRDRVQARAGYIKDGPPGSGPTVGLGFSTGKLQIDFAQLMSDVGAQAGNKPTYLTLRYVF
jgi:hypothetical protein